MKIDNYSKYVKEMYWPKVSVKKQLEMEHIITTLNNQSIRRSAEDISVDPDERPGDYDRPWRAAMSSVRDDRHRSPMDSIKKSNRL